MRFNVGRLARFAGLAAILVAKPVCGGGLHRYLGLGWGDGYHVGTTGCPGNSYWSGGVPTPATESVPVQRTPLLPEPERRVIPPEWDTSARVPTLGPAQRLARLPTAGESGGLERSSGIVRLPPASEPSSAAAAWR